jgi:hypothetical protein
MVFTQTSSLHHALGGDYSDRLLFIASGADQEKGTGVLFLF